MDIGLDASDWFAIAALTISLFSLLIAFLSWRTKVKQTNLSESEIERRGCLHSSQIRMESSQELTFDVISGPDPQTIIYLYLHVEHQQWVGSFSYRSTYINVNLSDPSVALRGPAFPVRIEPYDRQTWNLNMARQGSWGLEDAEDELFDKNEGLRVSLLVRTGTGERVMSHSQGFGNTWGSSIFVRKANSAYINSLSSLVNRSPSDVPLGLRMFCEALTVNAGEGSPSENTE